MDSNRNGVKSDANTDNLEFSKDVMDGESDGDDESKSLLRNKNDVLLKDSEKPRRKVQWLDYNGDKLAQILEFQPRSVGFVDYIMLIFSHINKLMKRFVLLILCLDDYSCLYINHVKLFPACTSDTIE
ncbi:hypothetical protein BUALT_Bualt14G0058900 [Buddleja alternifolia]|uniref:Uncharacterized protein n=1 Tax=Buddleja alternifolia TaxID=168488 RepID=A0AAV6WPV5_9LAMI|nr:hypothetical protein BUALT_Bualt14G0058900 [Buddleja alternifolia]